MGRFKDSFNKDFAKKIFEEFEEKSKEKKVKKKNAFISLINFLKNVINLVKRVLKNTCLHLLSLENVFIGFPIFLLLFIWQSFFLTLFVNSFIGWLFLNLMENHF